MLGKIVPLKQRIKYRLGDQMLSQHFNDVCLTDGVVKVITYLFRKVFKGGDFSGVVWVLQNGLDAVDVRIGDLGNVVGPVFPVVAVAALFDHLGVQGALDLTDFKLQACLVRDRCLSAGANGTATTSFFRGF